MTFQYRVLELKPQSAAVGAEVLNVDASAPLSDDMVEELLHAHGEHGVLFFRDQVLSPEQHVAFAERLGTINVNRFFRAVDGHPRIAEVLKEPGQTTNIGSKWHTDHSYDVAPALGSILYARDVPDFGGDTMFSNMYRAWDALSDGMRATLNGMRAVHTSRKNFGKEAYKKHKDADDVGTRLGNAEAATQDAIHDVGITHPVTGKRALYVNTTFTERFEGWTEAESQPLLKFLYEHGSRPEFTCRFSWRKNSIAFWDNRCTWHLALNDYHGHRRLMHRITLEGTPLEPSTAR